jgi:hypothetical protein
MSSIGIIEVLIDAEAYSEHGALIRCSIGAKTVERSEIEYMNLRLIINTYNILIALQLNRGLF